MIGPNPIPFSYKPASGPAYFFFAGIIMDFCCIFLRKKFHFYFIYLDRLLYNIECIIVRVRAGKRLSAEGTDGPVTPVIPDSL